MRLHLALLCLGLTIPAQALGDEDEPAAYGEPVSVDELLPNEPGEWELQASLEASQQPRESDGESPTYLVAVPRAQLLVGLVEGLGGGQLEIGASLGMAITRSAVTWQGTVGYSLAPGDLEEADLPDFELQLALGPAVRWSITPQLAMSAGALFGVTQAATPLRFIIEAQQEF